MLENGTKVAGYEIEGMLGHGGMGVVYEARQLALGRKVALKILAGTLGMDPSFKERFRNEGRIQAAIDHPHIVTVFEAGEWEDSLFIAMRLVRGPNLKEMIIARELEGARTLRILRPIAEALDAAHEAGLIHRDIKPQNILVGCARPRLPGRLRPDEGHRRRRADPDRPVRRARSTTSRRSRSAARRRRARATSTRSRPSSTSA